MKQHFVRGTIAFTLAGTLAATTLAASAWGQPEYEFILVGSFNPGFGESYLYDINELNQAVGVATKSNVIGYPPVVWTESAGKTIIAGVGWPHGISNSGWVVGVAQTYHIPTNQFFTPPLIPGTYPILNFGGVNEAGVAVGIIFTCNCSNSGGVQQIPLIWDQAGGSRTIAIPNAKGLKRINNDNIAIGWMFGNASLDGFFVDIDTGQFTLLSDIFPPIGVSPTRAADINDAGQIVGTRYGTGAVFSYGYVYDPAKGFEILPFAGAPYQQAMNPSGINNAGTIVGDIFINGSSRAFIYTQADGTRDLNNASIVEGLPAGYVMMSAQQVNDNGWIVGYGYGGGAGIYSGFVLKPIDTPCYADCDGNGTLTIFDYICFGNAYSAQQSYADCDGSGTFNVFDYICFGNEYAAGCP